MMRMRILVTDGTGYIGSHAAVALLDAGYEVAILDNLNNRCIEVIDRIKMITNRPLAFHHADIRNRAAVDEVFSVFHPDAVIQFAGLKAVGESLQDPLRYYEYNVAGSVALFQCMKKFKVKNLVFSSSANVYEDAAEVHVREDASIAPTNPYGQSKGIIEQVLADFMVAATEWRIARLRYFNPMGAHESGLIGEDTKRCAKQFAACTFPKSRRESWAS